MTCESNKYHQLSFVRVDRNGQTYFRPEKPWSDLLDNGDDPSLFSREFDRLAKRSQRSRSVDWGVNSGIRRSEFLRAEFIDAFPGNGVELLLAKELYHGPSGRQKVGIGEFVPVAGQLYQVRLLKLASGKKIRVGVLAPERQKPMVDPETVRPGEEFLTHETGRILLNPDFRLPEGLTRRALDLSSGHGLLHIRYDGPMFNQSFVGLQIKRRFSLSTQKRTRKMKKLVGFDRFVVVPAISEGGVEYVEVLVEASARLHGSKFEAVLFSTHRNLVERLEDDQYSRRLP